MSDDSGYTPKFGYDIRVRPPKKGKPRPSERLCEWPGCNSKGEHRAPKSKDNLDQHQWLCLDHVREFNRSWNFFKDWSDDELKAYREEASTGHRPTWKVGTNQSYDFGKGPKNGYKKNGWAEDPFGMFDEDGVEQPRVRAAKRKIPKALERSFVTLNLVPPSNPKQIKARYKELAKKFHPDLHQGEKNYEERLKAIIEAYQNLRSAGFC